ncbi:Enkurin domain-containing protein isoform 2 [Schistosoma japonicum]|nr:Enkurin domain-containing protein isoform 2 [Schistosoma japonicum]TNN05290.1 Enkurin domain-containing protein isoform 2 [Schistosoma japonicum]TNN05291.1 Enkurin domain-containing protein isoform 2 [Schistosoma japonicum]
MNSVLSYHPLVIDNYTNMYKPNPINYELKSTDETYLKCTNDPAYSIGLLQWQLDKSNESMNQLLPHSKHKKDYIRENILRLRQLEKDVTLKRITKQSSESICSTNRTRFNVCTKVATCHNAPIQQSKPIKNSALETKLNMSNHSTLSTTSTPIKPDKQNDLITQNRYQVNLNSASSMCEVNSNNINETDNHKSSQLKSSSMIKQIGKCVNQLTQTQTSNSFSLSSKTKPQSNQHSSLLTANKSDKNIHRILTPISCNSKTDYLRAHTRDVENESDLKLLSSMPISPINKRFNSAKMSVPKAESAKYVEFIRRDINFIRANAHLASVPNVKRTGIRRISSMNSLSLNDKTHLTGSNISKSQLSHRSRMWPERRLRSGVIPPYLIKMRQKEKERIQKELENQPDPDQPPGHQLMPEQERLNTLELLNNAHSQLLEEFFHLPVRMDTLRIRSRRAEIENRLSELEQAIEIFNKPKVFIKPD